jgi:threonylcarbamoyladenosine tRNA methylthiotransferase MtaB
VSAGETYAIYTLGCKLNYAEGGEIGRKLEAEGYRRAEEGEEVAVWVVNTCGVTGEAEKKSRGAIRRIRREHPSARVVVRGCYARLRREEVQGMVGVEVDLGEGVDRFVGACSRGGRTRYFLKVQDGCNYRCSYCTIPAARGRSRNGGIRELMEQARRVVEEGGKEIVLTGVNIGDYGRSTGETFLELLVALDAVEGIARYRISSIEPDLLSDELIEYVAGSERFAHHFHLPLQSGSDGVLRLMGRRYGVGYFRGRVERIREVMPEAFIGVDVIAGMHGETEEQFEETLGYLEGLEVSKLHVFGYSERGGTVALGYEPKVGVEERRRRVGLLVGLSERKLEAFYAGAIGSEGEVLWEGGDGGAGGKMYGYTGNYIRVEGAYVEEKVNSLEPVRLTGWNCTNSQICCGM